MFHHVRALASYYGARSSYEVCPEMSLLPALLFFDMGVGLTRLIAALMSSVLLHSALLCRRICCTTVTHCYVNAHCSTVTEVMSSFSFCQYFSTYIQDGFSFANRQWHSVLPHPSSPRVSTDVWHSGRKSLIVGILLPRVVHRRYQLNLMVYMFRAVY
jgi:hypothetical protein